MTRATHTFRFSGDAYDACMCDETVKTGDILICTENYVVGVADTWPIAVTPRRGELHTVEDLAALGNYKPELVAAYFEARKVAEELGWMAELCSYPRLDIEELNEVYWRTNWQTPGFSVVSDRSGAF